MRVWRLRRQRLCDNLCNILRPHGVFGTLGANAVFKHLHAERTAGCHHGGAGFLRLLGADMIDPPPDVDVVLTSDNLQGNYYIGKNGKPVPLFAYTDKGKSNPVPDYLVKRVQSLQPDEKITSIVPVRFGVTPEIVLLTLKSK